MDRLLLKRLELIYFTASQSDYESAILALNNDNLFVPSNIPTTSTQTSFLDPQRIFPYLNDTGAGPISTGVSSIQTASMIVNGTSANALSFFDKVTKITSARIASSSEAELVEIIISEIQMQEHLNFAIETASPHVIPFLQLMRRCAEYLKVGKFKSAIFLQEILSISKRIVTYNVNVSS
jgi:hypothetical protein